MTLKHVLQVVWARKWLVLALMVLVSAAGITTVMMLPRQYTAESSMVVEMRIDPVLGALAPSLAAPGYMPRAGPSLGIFWRRCCASPAIWY